MEFQVNLNLLIFGNASKLTTELEGIYKDHYKFFDIDLNNSFSISKLETVLDKNEIKIKNYVHCSGMIEPIGNFDQLNINDFNEIINLNYLSMMSFISNFLCIFNKKSKILMIGSLLGQVYLRQLALYCLSKNLMYNSYNLLKDELNSKEIYVGYVMPGVVNTKMADKLEYSDKSLFIEAKVCVRYLDYLLNLEENEFQQNVWDIYDENFIKFWSKEECKIYPPNIIQKL